MRDFISDYDPYAALLQCQSDIEALDKQLHDAILVINQQATVIRDLSHYTVQIAQVMENYGKRINQLEEYHEE